MTLRDKLMIYIYRKMSQLESDRNELRVNLRFHAVDSLDMYEIMREEIRISAWNEFIDELFNIVLNNNIK